VHERIDVLTSPAGRETVLASLAADIRRDAHALGELDGLADPLLGRDVANTPDVPLFLEGLVDDTTTYTVVCSRGTGAPPCRCRRCLARTWRGGLTRLRTRYAAVERFALTDPRLMTLTQSPTLIVDVTDAASMAATLRRDYERLSARLRRLTLSSTWRDRATAWAIKIEVVHSTPAHRAAVGGSERPGTWWHVHAHVVAWGEYWPQADLQAAWRATSTDGTGTAWIGAPRGGLMEVMKYVCKPLDFARSDRLVGAALILGLSRRRLLRLGGALDGLHLVDGDVDGDVTDSDVDGHAVGPTSVVDGAVVRARLRTPSGRWILPGDVEVWVASPWVTELARAWRERVWWAWRDRHTRPIAPCLH